MDDLYWEHSQHTKMTGYLFKNCSECNKEYLGKLKDRQGYSIIDRELELASERSVHSEETYW